MNNEQLLDRIANLCGYNRERCVKGDCTNRELCKTCRVMKEHNPEAYEAYRKSKR